MCCTKTYQLPQEVALQVTVAKLLKKLPGMGCNAVCIDFKGPCSLWDYHMMHNSSSHKLDKMIIRFISNWFHNF